MSCGPSGSCCHQCSKCGRMPISDRPRATPSSVPLSSCSFHTSSIRRRTASSGRPSSAMNSSSERSWIASGKASVETSSELRCIRTEKSNSAAITSSASTKARERSSLILEEISVCGNRRSLMTPPPQGPHRQSQQTEFCQAGGRPDWTHADPHPPRLL
ncbi:hypothetical protein PsAD26_04301 [Pseudovibrio sp. Ad26]|nr:hypothetical protein PsAD26_04301 [Pseudovibrio sp. Ad26]